MENVKVKVTWTPARRALAAACEATGYNVSPEEIARGIASLSNASEETIADLAEMVMLQTVTNSLPRKIEFSKAVHAGQLIWDEVISSLAENQKPKQPYIRRTNLLMAEQRKQLAAAIAARRAEKK